MNRRDEDCCSAMPIGRGIVEKIDLFVIRQSGTDYFWNCSAEHGCGWNPGQPKQSFSKSELTREIARMILSNQFVNSEIVRLKLSGD